jgi:hypothetical protein
LQAAAGTVNLSPCEDCIIRIEYELSSSYTTQTKAMARRRRRRRRRRRGISC